MGPGDRIPCCTASRFRRYLRSKAPFLAWMRKYNLKCLQGDIIAGLTVGMMVIPQGLAYAHLAELPPNYGLYASFVGVLVYIFTGTCKDITIGPTAIMSQIVAEVAKGNTKLALCVSLISGSLQMVMGFFFLGFVVWVISTPILCGFTTAAALTIGFGQLSKLLGIKGVRRQFWQNIYDTFKSMKQTRWPDAVMGIICLVCLFSLRILQKWVEAKEQRERSQPEPIARHRKIVLKCAWFMGVSRNIIIVIIATIIAFCMSKSDESGPFQMVGNITGGLPAPRVDQFSRMFNDSKQYCFEEVAEASRWTCKTTTTGNNVTAKECHEHKCCFDPDGVTKCYSKGFEVSEVISGSILVASIGYLEHIAIGQSFAVKGSYQIDNSQELIGLGLANVVGSFFSGYPITGSFSRTALNYMTGVKTPLVGLFTSGIVMLGLSFLSGYFEYVPDACLAAVIMVAVYPMVDFQKPIYFWKVSKKEFLVWCVCFFLILVFNIEIGIIAAIAVEVSLLLGRNMWPVIKIEHLHDGIYNFKIQGSIWYLGASTLKEKLTSMINGTYIKDTPGATHKVKNIVIDFSTVTSADSTSLDKIKEAIVLANKKDIRIVGYAMLDSVKTRAGKQGIFNLLTVCKTQAEAEQAVLYVTDESAQPAYVQYPDPGATSGNDGGTYRRLSTDRGSSHEQSIEPDP